MSTAKRARITIRDADALATIAMLHLVRSDDVARLLGGLTPIAARTARAVIQRWRTMGFAKSHRLGDSYSSVAITAEAARFLGTPEIPTGLPAWSQIPHTLTLSAIAIAAYVTNPLAGQWHRPSNQPGRHTPDGLVTTGTLTTAIECELTPKSAARWSTITAELLDTYENTHYWCTPTVERSFGKFLAQNLPPEDRQRLQILPIGGLAR